MKFHSTRSAAPLLSLSEALLQSLAVDGGLFVPVHFPKLSLADFSGLKSLGEIAQRWLEPFFAGDPLEKELTGICERAFSFPTPMTWLRSDAAVLELFHGPTAAFKDVGARFLAECLLKIPSANPDLKRTVLVATSGDTGGAVAAAFFNRPGFEVLILYPKGRVSPLQEKQLTCWGGNVKAFSVRGDFDDGQKMVKDAFLNPLWHAKRNLISANSISLGRLLPQAVYFIAAALVFAERGLPIPGFIVPTGNVGNAVAGLWAKKSGLEFGPFVLATNANTAIADYIKTGIWQPRATIATLANAMDVGNPSNIERLINLYPDLSDLRRDVSAVTVSDGDLINAIKDEFESGGKIWCPHTAVAIVALKRQKPGCWVLLSTAHAAKFSLIVAPIVAKEINMPADLAALLERPSHSLEIEPTLESLGVAVGVVDANSGTLA